jgi:hypothetical protein
MLPSAGCAEILGSRSKAPSPAIRFVVSEDEVLEGKIVGRLEGVRKDANVL